VLAAQALGALLAEHPRDRVDNVALAASVGTDDRRDAGVEGKLRPFRKALEAGDFETIQTHSWTDHAAEAAGIASTSRIFWKRRLDTAACCRPDIP
jgi:hypothetical protein